MAEKAAPVSLILVWHFHQPNYRSPISGRYELPWTRLHIAKDYLRMALTAKSFPGMKMVFNYTPCLLEQIIEYAAGTANDTYFELSRKEADSLSEDEKLFILDKFFDVNQRTVLRRNPRYLELYLKREKSSSRDERRKTLRKFTTSDFRDLQVLFNLSWIDESHHDFCNLREVAAKRSGFDESEKKAVLDAHTALAKETFSEIKTLWERDAIELWLSPYYHPILPLLCDSEISKVSAPGMTGPQSVFKFPQDAAAQVRKSVEFAETHLGKRPAGMWPSEGSVSDEALGIIAGHGFKYISTDEEILGKTLGIPDGNRGEILDRLYLPYSVETASGPLGIFFRDRALSDLIGFNYSSWNPETAAEDFVGRVGRIAETRKEGGAVVTVTLDGENCWEYYDRNGAAFLENLYGMLSQSEGIQPVFPAEVGGKVRSVPLRGIWPGSWIGHAFRIWIGHSEKNRAWDLLTAARKKLEEMPRQSAGTGNLVADECGKSAGAFDRAMEHLRAAEGSDWFWWFGDDFYTSDRQRFDKLFREHLMAAYREMGQEIPSELYEEVSSAKAVPSGISLPAELMTPVIDGADSNFYEWRSAGRIPCEEGGGFSSAAPLVKDLYYAFDLENLYIRVDTDPKPKEDNRAELSLLVEIDGPRRSRLRISPWSHDDAGKLLFERSSGQAWERAESGATAAAKDITEVKIPFSDLGAPPGIMLSLIVMVVSGNNVVESWPLRGRASFQVPSADYDDRMWSA